MKLGLISDWSEDGIKRVRDYGLDYTEFCINGDIDSAAVLSDEGGIRDRLARHGVKVGACGRWGMKRLDTEGNVITEARQHDYNVIDLCEKIACPVFNCGVNFVQGLSFEENCKRAVDYLSHLLIYGEERGVKIAVYNCDWENFICDPKVWDVVLPQLPKLGLKYDPSHCINHNRTFEKYLPEIRDYGDRIYHFHLKGVTYIDGKPYDEPPVGLDSIRWGNVFDLLYTKDYDGVCSLEPHSPRWTGKKASWGVSFSIGYMKPFFMPEDYAGRNGSNPYQP